MRTPISDIVLSDIIRVFLFGIKTKYRDAEGYKVPDIITDEVTICSWQDVFDLRNPITSAMKDSGIQEIVELSKLLKKIWKESENVQY